MSHEQPIPEPALVFLVNKPLHWTSFDVVKKLKYAGKFKKIGHAGTLDPLATGLLILCTGKMTKQIDSYQAQCKEYTGSFELGKTTPSVDLELDFDATYPTDHIDEALMEKARLQLSGQISQLPPIYSAVKQDGKKLYDIARKGNTVEIKPRSVQVFDFQLDYSKLPEVSFYIKCSKGTYIRSLVRDFGVLCGSGAYLKSLCRTAIGEFALENAQSIEQLVQELQKNSNIETTTQSDESVF
jgi:tRNA pseudouridine55 synthase